MMTKRHTQRLVKWLEEEKWINKQFNHIPFSDAKVFKLKQDRLGFGRLGSGVVAIEEYDFILAKGEP